MIEGCVVVLMSFGWEKFGGIMMVVFLVIVGEYDLLLLERSELMFDGRLVLFSLWLMVRFNLGYR